MSRRKTHAIRGMLVNPKKCKTCPFQEDGCQEIRRAVEERCMTVGSQTCHGTNDTTLCRGARDRQIVLFHRLGVLTAPTEQAWNEAMQALTQRH